MTVVYFINNSLTINNLSFPLTEPLNSRREKRVLSVEGEEEAKKLSYQFKDVQIIYTSSYAMSIGTAKYLAKENGIEMEIRQDLGERVLGELKDKKIRMVSEAQENDFDYKLTGGESLNEVKRRMLYFLDDLLIHEKDKTVAVFSHNVAITSLLSEYCNKGFNLDNRLILNYEDKAIVDGTWDGITVIEMKFQDRELQSIQRKK